jgi:hypothetical protein
MPSDTPILDLEQEPSEPRRHWLVTFSGFPLTVALGTAPWLAGWFAEDAPPCNGFLWLPALWFAILFHEMGHVFVGMLAGMDVSGLCVSGFEIFKTGQRLAYRFEGRHMFGGFARIFPLERDFRRTPFAWMVAGGPIASLLLVGICGIGILMLGTGTWDWIGTMFWTALLP